MSVKKEPKSKKFTNKMKKKLLVIFLLVGIVLLGLSYALIRLNLSKGKSYSKAENEALFFSYKREKTTGRHLSVIFQK